MKKEMTKKITVGLLKGPVQFWRDGEQVSPSPEGTVSCTSVRLPKVFVSEETDKNGNPVLTGYTTPMYVDAAQFANAIGKLDLRDGGGDIEVPVVMEGYTSVTTGDHSYKLWSFAVRDGEPLVAWDELRLVPKQTTEGLPKELLQRFGKAKASAFPTVVPVARAPWKAKAKAKVVAEVSDR